MISALGFAVLSLAPQGEVTVHGDVQYSETAKHARRNRLDLFVPDSDTPPPMVMFVHGGSWTGGSKDHFDAIGETIAAEGFACATINTRLFPFAKPAEMVVDCANALGFLHRHGADYGYDGDQLFVMGHSSGAHLCSWLAYDDDKLALAGVPKRALRGAVLLSGVYDVRARHFLLDGVFGDDGAARRRASTWLYVDPTDCPTYVSWAQRELPGLPLCGELLRDRLLSSGIPVEWEVYRDRSHANYIFQFGTRRDVVTRSVVRFLRDPKAAKRVGRRSGPCAMLWMAADDRERRLGEAVARVCGPAGVDVIVQMAASPDAAGVTDFYRALRRDRAGAGRSPLCFVAGYGIGGAAVASCSLTGAADGLLGRFVAGSPLGRRSLQAARLTLEPSQAIGAASLLSICGDEDDAQIYDDARACVDRLRRKGKAASAYLLMGTTAEAALQRLDAEEDFIRPMLLTFLGVF